RMGGRRKMLGTLGLAVTLVVVPVVGAAPAPADVATFEAHGSVEQVYVTHAAPGSDLELRDSANGVVAHGVVDDLGSFLFRDIVPGDGYTVVEGAQTSDALHVMTRTENPPTSFYANQHLVPGFGYITTRDGTQLSADITLPGPPDRGPYPTVIEYSGYDP